MIAARGGYWATTEEISCRGRCDRTCPVSGLVFQTRFDDNLFVADTCENERERERERERCRTTVSDRKMGKKNNKTRDNYYTSIIFRTFLQ